MTPGYKTTEFWLTLATTAVGLVAVVLGLTPAQSADLMTHVTSAVVALGTIAGAAAAVWKYIHDRTEIKLAALDRDGDGVPDDEDADDDNDGVLDLDDDDYDADDEE
jgi:hypothetical protein